jgi:ABC-2 type transport system ATP-binding protein
MISVDNLSYRIGPTVILRELNLQVPRGSFFALAGENGAGKSTLIKIVLDLIRHVQSGQVSINGHTREQIRARADLVFLPEKFDVEAEVSGWRYLKFVFAMYNMPFNRPRVIAYSEAMGLDPARLADKVNTYSKGMKQKLGLVSCFMLEKPLMILDEPLSGLDPSARYRFKQALQQYRRDDNTVFYSTHMLADAEEICDRFAILHGGNIVFEGTPKACKAQFEATTLEQAYMKCIAAASCK